MTGLCPSWIMTSESCKRIFSLFAMTGDRQSRSVSAQSPPWTRNLFPCCASAKRLFRRAISQDVTSGGSWQRRAHALSSAEGSYAIACESTLDFHESGVHEPVVMTSLTSPALLDVPDELVRI